MPERGDMTFSQFILALALTGLTGCMETGGTSSSSAPPAVTGGNLAPPPGRTEAERQARKDAFRGPRGDI